MSTNQKVKYFCQRCKSPKPAKVEPQFSENSTVLLDQEIVKKMSNGFVGRQLNCGHFVSITIPGFNDPTSENLNEWETLNLRREIDKTMLGKQAKEVEQQILFQVEQYQTLLKIASKQKQQAKYAIQYLDQLREKFSSQLNQTEKDNLEMRFAHFLNQRPVTNKTIERERNAVDKEVDKQKAALEAVRALLGKSGYKPKDLF